MPGDCAASGSCPGSSVLKVIRPPMATVVTPSRSEILSCMGLPFAIAQDVGTGAHAITSGLEVTWTTTPVRWSNDYFKHLFEYEWELTESSAGAK